MAVYYVDSLRPDDTGNGLLPGTAWKTVSKVSGMTFLPGDFILFRCGGVWREHFVVPSSGSAGLPLTVGNYVLGESTNKPVIAGSELQTGWEVFTGAQNIVAQSVDDFSLNLCNSTSQESHAQEWIATTATISQVVIKANMAGTITAGNLTVEIWNVIAGVPQAVIANGAATPVNATTLTTNALGAEYTFVFPTPPVLTIGDTYLFKVGGTFAVSATNFVKLHAGAGQFGEFQGRWKFTPWVRQTDYQLYIKIQKPAQNVWRTAVAFEPKTATEDGLYSDNVLAPELLARPYQWNYTAGLVYTYGLTAPTTFEAGKRDRCISIISKAYVTVDGVNCDAGNLYGVRIEGTSNNIIARNNVLCNNREFGILAAGTGIFNISILNNRADYNGSFGIKATQTVDNLLVKGNNCTHNGCYRGDVGEDVWGGGIGFYGFGVTNVTVESNIVSWSGYNRLGERLQLSNINKGQGIWLDTSNGITPGYFKVFKNLTTNCAGAGIYIEKSDAALVYHNISHSNTYDGIRIDTDENGDAGVHISKNNKIYNNVVFGNLRYGLCASGGWAQSAMYCRDNIWKNNISFGNGVKQLATLWGGENDGLMGTGNIYENNALGFEGANLVEWGEGVSVNSYAAFNTWYAKASNSVQGDPKISGAFKLVTGSPCINAGVDVGLLVDAAGKSIAGLPDVGAYEYAALVPGKGSGGRLSIGVGIGL